MTGTHGSLQHMGNAIAPNPDQPIDLETGMQNLTSLAHKFDTTRYLTPTSDIVALMTLEHQARMTNLIFNVGRQFQRASQTWNPDRGQARRLDAAIDELVAYMVFDDEAPLGEPVKGVSTRS